MTTPSFFTPPQLARRWGCTPGAVLALIKSAALAAFTISPPGSRRPRWKITEESVRDYEAGRSAPAPVKSSTAPTPRRSRKKNRTSRWAS